MGLSGSAIVPVATYTADVYPPAAGTPVLAADVEAGEQAFANRWEWLLAQPRVAHVYRVGLASATANPLTHATVGTFAIPGGSWSNAVHLANLGSLLVGDVVDIRCVLYVRTSGNGGASVCLGNTIDSLSVLADSAYEQTIDEWKNADVPLTFTTSVVMTSAMLSGGVFSLYVLAAGEPFTLTVKGPWHLTATVYRTGV